jgi:hypothetical protein
MELSVTRPVYLSEDVPDNASIHINKVGVLTVSELGDEARQIFTVLSEYLPSVTYDHLLAIMLAEKKRQVYFDTLRKKEELEL